MAERVGGVVGVGEVVAGEGDDDLGSAVGEHELVAMGGVRIPGVPEGADIGGEGRMRKALEVEHASASCGEHLSKSVCAAGPGLWGEIVGK